jgi:hypothetical protein
MKKSQLRQLIREELNQPNLEGLVEEFLNTKIFSNNRFVGGDEDWDRSGREGESGEAETIQSIIDILQERISYY